MTPRTFNAPRQRQPELEFDHVRTPGLGYEAPADTGLVRCITHGYPTPLARWHFHDEYELHLITASAGKAFVGDWIGPFEPGHLVLCGPRLPHNWISTDLPEAGVPERDLVIQFAHGPLVHAAQGIPEMGELLALLERARYGIEFFDVGERAQSHFRAVKAAQGLQRLAAFIAYMSELARWTDFRLLSSVPLQGDPDATGSDRVSTLLQRIARDHAQPLSAAQLAAELGMSETRFSRFFGAATGSTFKEYINRIRVSRAGQLLMNTDSPITQICYEVGFNNVSNFNRRFLEIKGMTPSQFRQQAQRRFGVG